MRGCQHTLVSNTFYISIVYICMFLSKMQFVFVTCNSLGISGVGTPGLTFRPFRNSDLLRSQFPTFWALLVTQFPTLENPRTRAFFLDLSWSEPDEDGLEMASVFCRPFSFSLTSFFLVFSTFSFSFPSHFLFFRVFSALGSRTLRAQWAAVAGLLARVPAPVQAQTVQQHQLEAEGSVGIQQSPQKKSSIQIPDTL